VLFGYGGGALGATGLGTNVALTWDASRNVMVQNNLTLNNSLSVSNNLNIDYQNSNTGSVTMAAMTFGQSSGEGIASNETAAAIMPGWTSTRIQPRLSIANNGNVGIGKTNPAVALDVNGTVTATASAAAGEPHECERDGGGRFWGDESLAARRQQCGQRPIPGQHQQPIAGVPRQWHPRVAPGTRRLEPP